MFRCSVCGEIHDALPEIGYLRPADYFEVPPDEREERIYLTEDICVIDNEHFLVRGVLPVPIKGTDAEWSWGVWAILFRRDFERYLELWDASEADEEPPFGGRLSGGVEAYPDSDGLKVGVYLQSGNQRPIFEVVSEDHPLGVAQREGVTMEQIHAFIEDAFPGYFQRN
jgi:hypothetical protein